MVAFERWDHLIFSCTNIERTFIVLIYFGADDND
jgi:hypothetical protein